MRECSKCVILSDLLLSKILYLFSFVLGLHCWAGLSLIASSGDCSPIAAHGFLISVASFAAEHRFQGMWAQQLWFLGSRAQAWYLWHGFSCSAACGLFPEPCLLHLQMDSLLPSLQGSSNVTVFYLTFYFVLGNSQLTMLWQFQVGNKGTQPYIYMYPFSPKLPSHPGCHITLSRVPCALQ